MGNAVGIALCLAGLAGATAARGQSTAAARLLGAADAAMKCIGAEMEPSDRTDFEHYLNRTRARLSGEAFTASWTDGKAMTLEQAIEYALGSESA
jgi:hypothetical protein